MSDAPDLARIQRAFAAHIRDPQANPRPPDVEARRMAIYRELIYNNLESFLAANFPVVRRTLGVEPWRGLVGDFLRDHRCETPLFAEIGQEFLDYLQNEREPTSADPPFLLELAHYEWVELALTLSDADRTLPRADPNGDPFSGVPILSPLAWNLTYRFPVHRIGPEFQPKDPGPEPTHLVVYRDRQGEVKFLEINPVTQRLLQLLHENPGWRGLEALERIADELRHPEPEQVIQGGRKLLQDLRTRGIILGARR